MIPSAVLLAHPLVGGFLFAWVGLLLGSFAGVVGGRWPARLEWAERRDAHLALGQPFDEPAPRGWWHGRSTCDTCGTALGAIDLIPILGWIWPPLGRCRHCGAAIRWPTLLVEAAGGALGLLIFLTCPPNTWLLVIPALILLYLGFVVDLTSFWLPNALTYPLLILGLLGASLGWPLLPAPGQAILGMLVGAGIPWALDAWVRWRRGVAGMGGGDIVLLAAAGAWLGIIGALFTLGVGAILTLLAWGSVSLVRRKKGDVVVPFGPGLAIAFVTLLLAHAAPWPWLLNQLAGR